VIDKATRDRANRFKRHLRESAKQLGCKVGDERAIHLATLKAAREAVQARIIAGVAIDVGDLMKLDEALRVYMPVAGPKHITIEFVEGLIGVCHACGHEHRDYRRPEPQYPRTIDGEISPNRSLARTSARL
jgi:hypothetical protein